MNVFSDRQNNNQLNMNSPQQLSDPLVNKSISSNHSTYKQQLGFFSEIWLLTYKNIILTIKNPKNLLFLIITPFLMTGFLAAFQNLSRENGTTYLQNPPLRYPKQFTQCGWNDCISLDYRIIASTTDSALYDRTWIDKVISSIQTQTGIQKIYSNSTPITTSADMVDHYAYFEQAPNKTQIGLVLCATEVAPIWTDNLTTFCDTGKPYNYYFVLKKVNSLSVIFHQQMQPFPIDQTANALKNLIDNAILKIQTDAKLLPTSIINYVTSQYPVGPNRYIQNYDMVTSIGAFYFMITPLFAFLFIQNEIVREKQYKLRQGLNIFGASHASYWISWIFIAIIYALICSVSSFVAGFAFGFGFFTQTPFYIIIFLLFFPFCMAIQSLGFFLSTLSPTIKASNAVSYGVVLLAIVIESFVSDNNLLTFLFSTNATVLIQLLKIFLLFYPPFSYTKVFTNITVFSGYHFDISQRSWITSEPHYDINKFTENLSGPLPFGGGTFNRYSDLTSMFILYADTAFFLILTWYFDNIISTNRGRSASLFFPFQRIYKLFAKSKPKYNKTKAIDLKMNPKYLIQDQEQSAIRQRNRVYQNTETGIPALGLRIKCLSKTFTRAFSKDKVQAIKHLSIQIQPNELMGVLGHNGAGKTTLINILTGVLDHDKDEETQIYINDQHISNINQIRKHIGVCSQFDILWDQLTAEQHLYMFSRLKNIPQNLIDQRIDQILSFVNLLKEKKNITKGFSGGMKRRLSLAIAAIGNPKIILLDEPTTGLDPKVKQQVWHLVEQLKKNKSIILTTHSMEQADVLADRICVMAKGKLKCIGSSLYLKTKYGEGHRITLNVDKKKIQVMMETIKKFFPSAVMVDYKGGNLIVGISQFQQLTKFIRMLESQQSLGLEQYALKSSIKDWNVSHSTLQEVFMKVSKQKQE